MDFVSISGGKKLRRNSESPRIFLFHGAESMFYICLENDREYISSAVRNINVSISTNISSIFVGGNFECYFDARAYSELFAFGSGV